jgi:hypothetical protein
MQRKEEEAKKKMFLTVNRWTWQGDDFLKLENGKVSHL